MTKEEIYKIRKDRKLTQKQFGDAIELSSKMIRLMEKGECEISKGTELKIKAFLEREITSANEKMTTKNEATSFDKVIAMLAEALETNTRNSKTMETLVNEIKEERLLRRSTEDVFDRKITGLVARVSALQHATLKLHTGELTVGSEEELAVYMNNLSAELLHQTPVVGMTAQ